MFKDQVHQKQQIVNEHQEEVNELKDQLKGLQKNIADRKRLEKSIRESISGMNISAKEILAQKQQEINNLKKMTTKNK